MVSHLHSDIDTLDEIVVPADDGKPIPEVDQLQPRNKQPAILNQIGPKIFTKIWFVIDFKYVLEI